MKALITLLLTSCLTISISASDSATPIPQLAPFASLLGTTWVGEFPTGGAVDEQEFEWVFGGKFLRNVHRVKSSEGVVAYEGETIYAWDPIAETIVWWYWNTTGGYITGTMSEGEDGWSFEGTNHAPPPQPQKVRGLLRLNATGTWDSVQYFPGEDGWKERFTITFRPANEE